MSENPEKSPVNQEGAPQNTGNPPSYEQTTYPPPAQAPYYQPPPGAYQPPPPSGYPKQNMPQGSQDVQGGMVVTNQPGPVVMTGQPGYPQTQTIVVTTDMTSPPPDYLIFSILTILCCWPLAIAAIIFSCGSRSASRRGDYTTALSKGRTAKFICLTAVMCGVIILSSNVVVRAIVWSEGQSYTLWYCKIQ